jgi:DNA-binding NarL/FixJ family response regulator
LLTKQIKILLADDHALVLQGLKKLLGAEYQVVGEVTDGSVVPQAAVELRPDLILLDISMAHVDGLEAARQVRKIYPRAKIIFVTMNTEPTMIMEAFRVGASGYVLKQSAPSELHTAISTVLRHGWFLSTQIGEDIRENISAQVEGIPTDELSGRLTNRQQSVLRLIASGYTSKQIAKTLGISLRTVAFHRTNIMQALGIRAAADLTKYAVEKGLTKRDDFRCILER